MTTEGLAPAAPKTDTTTSSTTSSTTTGANTGTGNRTEDGSRARRRTETARLLADAGSADSLERRSALLDEVIRLNMSVARDIAQRYHNRGLPDEDLDQVANLALVKAAQAFDPSHGSDFLSFAVPTIRGELRRYFRDNGWTVRPPRSVQETQTRIAAAEGELFQSLGRSPRPSEIAEHLGADVALVQDSLAANGCFTPASLDAPYAEGDGNPAERLGAVEPGFASAEARVMLRDALRGLTPRERRMLEMRFFGGCTQAEIGAEVGVTQMQVSRLLTRLLGRLREKLEGEGEGVAVA